MDMGEPALQPAMGLTENNAKEAISIAFLRAVAAQAGLNVRQTGEYDDGLDWDVGSIRRPFQDLPCAPNTWISFQLKATADWALTENGISFWLDRDIYDLLRDECATPVYLLVYTLPLVRDEWINFCLRDGGAVMTNHYCELNHTGFFLDLRGAGPVPDNDDGMPQTGVTVHLPLANRVTARTLLGLYRSAIVSILGGGE
jgi:hypothetical protein